jgi:ABC-type multidrug transport system permease subunit
LALFTDEADYNEAGMIEVHLDHTLFQQSLMVRKEIIDTYDRFVEKVLRMCGNSKRSGKFPITFENFKFNLKAPTSIAFVVLVLTSFSVFVTSISMIDERACGVWDRLTVSGIDPKHFLVSHVIQGLLVMFSQFVQFGVFCIFFMGFELSLKAKFLLLMVLLSIGTAGVSLGGLCSLLLKKCSSLILIQGHLLFSTQFFCGLQSIS